MIPSDLASDKRKINSITLLTSMMVQKIQKRRGSWHYKKTYVVNKSLVGPSIMERWATYFEKLSTLNHNSYDPSHTLQTEASIKNICALCSANNDTIDISASDVKFGIQLLKLKKALGPNSISAEHLYMALMSQCYLRYFMPHVVHPLVSISLIASLY